MHYPRRRLQADIYSPPPPGANSVQFRSVRMRKLDSDAVLFIYVAEKRGRTKLFQRKRRLFILSPKKKPKKKKLQRDDYMCAASHTPIRFGRACQPMATPAILKSLPRDQARQARRQTLSFFFYKKKRKKKGGKRRREKKKLKCAHRFIQATARGVESATQQRRPQPNPARTDAARPGTRQRYGTARRTHEMEGQKKSECEKKSIFMMSRVKKVPNRPPRSLARARCVQRCANSRVLATDRSVRPALRERPCLLTRVPGLSERGAPALEPLQHELVGSRASGQGPSLPERQPQFRRDPCCHHLERH